MQSQVIKYIIIFEDNINNWPYNFYESYSEAETKRLTFFKDNGKVVKVTIEEIK